MRFTLAVNGGDPHQIRELARAAQEAGWSTVALNEGTFQPVAQEDGEPYPYTTDGRRSWDPSTPFLEPMTLLPALGMALTGLRFLTWVLKLPLREPLTFSKQVATAALMTGGRLDLGVGMSWMPQEYAYTGVDWETRRARFEETIEVLRTVLTGEVVEHHGAHFDFGPLMIAPVPQEPVRFVLAGHGPAALRMATRIGDGWCGVLGPRDALVETLGALPALLGRNDRDPATFTLHAGAVEATTVDDFAELEKLGLTDCIVMPWGATSGGAGTDATEASTAQKIDSIHTFAETVIHQMGPR